MFTRQAIGAGLLGLAMAVGSGAAPAAAAGDGDVTVMSRNIYLGADVSVALELIPDMPAAAQFMWEQVAQTDFAKRAPVLADELAREKPDVVALQEATTWSCRSSIIGSSTVVFDFTAQLLEATKATGVEYVMASANGQQAFNPGYSIPVLPFLTTVNDPDTFQPLFGSDEAACGFTIGDALLVRADLAGDVVAVGSGDYEAKYSVVPVIFEVTRGYTWADIDIAGTTTRFLTTHLESVWDEGTLPYSVAQARELIAATGEWTMPLVVIGDFNADPRDPRPAGAVNPGLQPDTTTGCAAQATNVDPGSADPTCNAYWAMVDAGFTDSGPDSRNPANNTWGASALLAGPDPDRLGSPASNAYGYTDRLDYIFIKNGVSVQDSSLVGAQWPGGPDMWTCEAAEQTKNALVAAETMSTELPEAFCLPTDHVGLVAKLAVQPQLDSTDAASLAISPVSLGIGVAIVLGLSGLVSLWAIRRSRPLS